MTRTSKGRGEKQFAEWMAEVAKLPVDHPEFLRGLVTTRGNATIRCVVMIQFLDAAIEKLRAPATSAKARESTKRDVDKMWKVYRGAQPEKRTSLVHRLHGLMSPVARLHGTLDPKHGIARKLFVCLLADTCESALAQLNAGVLTLVDECAAAWNRPRGRPQASDDAPRKWEAFAALANALLLTRYSADDVRKECSPSRTKKRAQRA